MLHEGAKIQRATHTQTHTHTDRCIHLVGIVRFRTKTFHRGHLILANFYTRRQQINTTTVSLPLKHEPIFNVRMKHQILLKITQFSRITFLSDLLILKT